MMAKRVLFLISDTGGGHRASANALADALRLLHGPALHCDIVDPFAEYARPPLNRVPQAYRPLVERFPRFWHVLWRLAEQPAVWKLAAGAVTAWQAAPLLRMAREHRADLAVSVHPLLSQTPRKALVAAQPEMRFATVVTDLASAPAMWYDPQVDLLVASCPAVERAALAAGLPRERVRRLGLPIGLDFASVAQDRCDARQKLGLQNLPTVLLVSGGEGMGPLEEIVDALSRSLAGLGAQIVAICGRNEGARDRLAGRDWPLPVTPLGFVSGMSDWMRVADCLVTKAGPGTIAEALACGLPMVLSSFVPGQETGNVAFVEENGVGIYCPEPAAIGARVASWLGAEGKELTKMSEQASALAQPCAALDIARVLSELL